MTDSGDKGLELEKLFPELDKRKLQLLASKLAEAERLAYQKGFEDGRFNPPKATLMSPEERREYNKAAKRRQRAREALETQAKEGSDGNI